MEDKLEEVVTRLIEARAGQEFRIKIDENFYWAIRTSRPALGQGALEGCWFLTRLWPALRLPSWLKMRAG